MKCSDICTVKILEYLNERQGQWTQLWYGNLKSDGAADVYYSMPEKTPRKLALAKMKNLHKRGLVGGCVCGCRGDFEITDKGLDLIGKKRTKRYSGY